MNRNIKNAISNESWRDTKAKYEKFLGIDSLNKLPKIQEFSQHRDPMLLANLLLTTYLDNLKKIGLNYVDNARIRRYYYLVFASGHERGLEFWRKVTTATNGGQFNLMGDLLG